MGQDRELSEQQKQFALATVEQYIHVWEEEERGALTADRDRRLSALEISDPETAGANDQTMSAEVA